MPKNGKFIVFEGIDGSGKTTQFNKLKEKLIERGIPFQGEKEPTDGVIGRLARETVERKLVLRPETLALIFAADRIEHTEAIISLLERGVNVLCDRYVFSSLAYQSVTLPMEKIIAANDFAINALLPHLTIFIDTAPEICMKRINENRSGPELFESVEQARVIRKNYNAAFEALGCVERLKTIDGNKGVAEVTENVWEVTKPLFGL